MEIMATGTWTPRGDLGRFVKENITPKIREATRDVGQIVLAEAQAIVPVDTGRLRDSGEVEMKETEHTVTAVVKFTAPYAAYVEYGTGIAGASSPGAGPYPYSMTWPGMPAKPYLRPALDMVRPEMIGEYALRMRK